MILIIYIHLVVPNITHYNLEVVLDQLDLEYPERPFYEHMRQTLGFDLSNRQQSVIKVFPIFNEFC